MGSLYRGPTCRQIHWCIGQLLIMSTDQLIEKAGFLAIRALRFRVVQQSNLTEVRRVARAPSSLFHRLRHLLARTCKRRLRRNSNFFIFPDWLMGQSRKIKSYRFSIVPARGMHVGGSSRGRRSMFNARYIRRCTSMRFAPLLGASVTARGNVW